MSMMAILPEENPESLMTVVSVSSKSAAEEPSVNCMGPQPVNAKRVMLSNQMPIIFMLQPRMSIDLPVLVSYRIIDMDATVVSRIRWMG